MVKGKKVYDPLAISYQIVGESFSNVCGCHQTESRANNEKGYNI